jgi:hypothetical protein
VLLMLTKKPIRRAIVQVYIIDVGNVVRVGKGLFTRSEHGRAIDGDIERRRTCARGRRGR